MVLFEGEDFSEEYPSPISMITPLPHNWVLNKVIEMQSVVGISCVGYEDQFKALLTAIEASHYQHGAV